MIWVTASPAAAEVGLRLTNPCASPSNSFRSTWPPASRYSSTKAVQVGTRMGVVLGALHVHHRRQFNRFAALQGQHRIALGHGFLVPPVLVVRGQHPVHQFRVRLAAGAQLQGVVVTRQGIDDRPAHHHVVQPHLGILEAVGRREGGVTRVVRAHGQQHRLVAAAGDPQGAHLVHPQAQRVGPRAQPADAVMDVGHRSRIRRHRRHAEIERRDRHAAARQRLADDHVVQTGRHGTRRRRADPPATERVRHRPACTGGPAGPCCRNAGTRCLPP